MLLRLSLPALLLLGCADGSPGSKSDRGGKDTQDTDATHETDAAHDTDATQDTDGGSDTDRTPATIDQDHDGYSQDEDCDDGDPDVHPGAVELAGDGVDNDCDSATCVTSGFRSTAARWTLPDVGGQHLTETAANAVCDGGSDYPTFSTMDLTGDGVPDLVVTYDCTDASVGNTRWEVYVGGSTGFASTPTAWSLPSYGGQKLTRTAGEPYCTGGANVPRVSTFDLTGDGIPDLVVPYECDDASVGNTHWNVYPGGSTGFAPTAVAWRLPSYGGQKLASVAREPNCTAGANVPRVSTFDLTGDGIPDLVVPYECDDASVGNSHWNVYPGGSGGFATTAVAWRLPSYGGQKLASVAREPNCADGANVPRVSTFDLTGDGIPDLVVPYECNHAAVGNSRWTVYPGGVGGFATTPTAWSLPSFGGQYLARTFGDANCANGANAPTVATMDLNADGRPDLVVPYACNNVSVGNSRWNVYLGGSGGFASTATVWSLPSFGGQYLPRISGTAYCTGGANYPTMTTMALDGGAGVDLVVSYACNSTSLGDSHWDVYSGSCDL